MACKARSYSTGTKRALGWFGILSFFVALQFPSRSLVAVSRVFESPSFDSETIAPLFWVSWFVLLYLAWPRLLNIARRLWRRRSPGKPLKLIVPPLRPKWDSVLEKYLLRATLVFLALSILELLFRRPYLERFSIPLFVLFLTLTILIRWWRSHFRQDFEQAEIVFPHIADNTALGLRLIKVQQHLEKLREIAAELEEKGGISKEIAAQLRELTEKVRALLVALRLERPDSPVLRQARTVLIRLEPLTDSFELLARLPDETEVRELSNGLVEVVRSAKSEFEDLRLAQGKELRDQLDILISVLRQLYGKANSKAI